jgi:AcrR family transcriptional regulator
VPRAGLDRAAVGALALAVVDDGGPTGYADLTLAAVAARAGVAVPSLYKHVGGLGELRLDVAAACVADFATTLEAARDAATGRGRDPNRDPERELRAMARATRAYALTHPGRYQAVQGAGWPLDPAADAVRAAAGRAVELLTEATAAAGVPPDRRIDAVRAFRAGVHGFVTLELGGGFGMPQDVDASFAYLVDLLVAGLVPPR